MCLGPCYYKWAKLCTGSSSLANLVQLCQWLQQQFSMTNYSSIPCSKNGASLKLVQLDVDKFMTLAKQLHIFIYPWSTLYVFTTEFKCMGRLWLELQHSFYACCVNYSSIPCSKNGASLKLVQLDVDKFMTLAKQLHIFIYPWSTLYVFTTEFKCMGRLWLELQHKLPSTS